MITFETVSMSDIISILPDSVANRIAAGEVVSRPAAAVKELLENAIDANADRILLTVKEGGKSLIQVMDNGKGMSENDSRMCFERHATSKIKDPDDIFRITTKGFRGEALASVAAIAKVELKTRQPESETGVRVLVEGSEFISSEICSTPVGTIISIKNLFFNVPARRKFLKSDAVESKHILEEFIRVALAHPEIEFEMTNNGQPVYKLEKGNFRRRIVGILGNTYNDKLVPVAEETDMIRISGFLVKPEFSRKTRGDQYFFANNRFIKSPYLHHAVESAFEGLIPKDSHPGYFLFLEIAPEDIDINIHPAKTEVKFSEERTIYHIIGSAVKQALGKFNLAPSLDFERETSFDFVPLKDISELSVPKIVINSDYNPFQTENKPGNRDTASFPGPTPGEKNNLKNWESLYTPQFDRFEIPSPAFSPAENGEEIKGTEALFPPEENDDFLRSSYFQLEGRYLVTSIKSGLVVIDQHRAHERIIFERLMKNADSGKCLSQQLLFPETIDFNPADLELIKEIREELSALGFDLELFGGNTVIVRGVPTGLTENNCRELLEEMLEKIKHQSAELKSDKHVAVVRSLADRMAVKYGTRLGKAEAETLIADLFSCTNPYSSPNGKPTLLTLSLQELNDKFLR
jgi:DNA mismatch repair protein MutL